MNARVLLIEDDQAIAMAVRDRLENEGYMVRLCGDGERGFEAAVRPGWDLILLDLMLPRRDGLQICRDLRAKGIAIPILMLTARDATIDKVVGLKMGADDYVSKPFEMMELLARVEALLRRGRVDTRHTHTIGSSIFDVCRGELRRKGSVTPLTTYELKLLKYFCEHRGEIIDRETLLYVVWGYETVPYTRTVDVHVARLRKKLGDSRHKEFIITVRGTGYKLMV